MEKYRKNNFKALNKLHIGLKVIYDIKHDVVSNYWYVRHLRYRLKYYDLELKDLIIGSKYKRDKLYAKMKTKIMEMVTYGVINFDEYIEIRMTLLILKKYIDKFYFLIKLI